MKNKYLFILINILIIIAFLYCGSSDVHSNQGKGEAVFEETTYDFGTVLEGSEVIHNFKFKNEGNGTLEITNLLPSCGCTVAFKSNDTVKPGEYGEISLRFDTSGREGKTNKEVIVIFKNNDTKELELKLYGIIKPIFDLSPDYVAFGMITEEKNPEIKVEITANPNINEDIKIKEIMTFQKYIKYRIEKDKELNNCFNLYLSVDYTKLLKEAREGGAFSNPYKDELQDQANFHGWVDVYTNSTYKKKIMVRFSGILSRPGVRR